MFYWLTYYYVSIPTLFSYFNLKMYLVCQMYLIRSKIQRVSVLIALETARDNVENNENH